MSARKKSSKKTTKKSTLTSDIPILTRRATPDNIAEAQETAVLVENFDLNTEYAQEIRALVTVAVNEFVPEMIDSIMDKLTQSSDASSKKPTRKK